MGQFSSARFATDRAAVAALVRLSAARRTACIPTDQQTNRPPACAPRLSCFCNRQLPFIRDPFYAALIVSATRTLICLFS